MTENDFFNALSGPTRRRILMLLADGGELCVCELTAALELAQPRISTHLAALRKAGLARGRRQGLWVHYSLSPELPQWARAIIRQTRRGLAETAPYREDARRLAAARAASASASASA